MKIYRRNSFDCDPVTQSDPISPGIPYDFSYRDSLVYRVTKGHRVTKYRVSP